MKNTQNRIELIISFLLFMLGVNLNAQVTCNGGTTNIPRQGTVLVNGVSITTTYSGDVQNYPYPFSSCNGSVTSSANSLLVGMGNLNYPTQSSPWSVTLNFNKPVNDLIIVLTATGTGGVAGNENFIFNSNGGTVSITAGTNCYSSISGNTINSGNGAPLDTSGTSGGGGGIFKISAATAYTQLTINGNGGFAGSTLAVCGVSIKEATCIVAGITPPVKNISNICPATTANLNSAHTGTAPNGSFITWYNNNTHTGSQLSAAQIAAAGSGTYYAFYYDNTNNCFSPASAPVTVTINTGTDSDGDSIPDACDLDDDNDGILDTIECTPTYLVRPVTSSSVTANKPITSGTAPQIADGEGAGGTLDGPFPNWYTNVSNLPIAFNMNMQSSSTIDHIKLYGPWGFDEWIGNFTVELYNAGNTLLGTENFVTPNQYTGTPIFSFTKEYTNVTRVRFTILSSQGYSSTAPPRASLNEIVFLDLQPLTCDTDNDGIPNHLDLDSDNDGCLDAIEGDENVTVAQLVNASGTVTVGLGSTAANQNLGNAIDVNGVPTLVNSGGAADIGSDRGQGVGSSQNQAVNGCPIVDCFPLNAYSATGWKATVYDAPIATNGWGQISTATTFPTSSYSKIATFDYNSYAGQNNAFDITFATEFDGVTSSNPYITNYSGIQLPYASNEDYAILFSKTIGTGEEGTYQFNLTNGDDHIFIYKNGAKISQKQNAYTGGPFNNFVTVSVTVGDTISVLAVEEELFNTNVSINATKTNGTIKPLVKDLTNICPSNTVNLNDSHTETIPIGSSLVWFTNNSHTGTALSSTQVSNAGAGTYYAFYYNATGSCYSAASNPVVVTINNCTPINNCVTGDCNDNTFLNTSNPNTLEYDNFISGFHSSIIKLKDGSYKVWGQGADPSIMAHLTSPTIINPANGFNYTGKILKAALGTGGASNNNYDQYAILTETGLYLWGGTGIMVSTAVKADRVFGKVSNTTIGGANSYGLPTGVNPSDVKMLFGSYGTLAITTCTGEAYVLSSTGLKNGDGTNDTGVNMSTWHRVKINATTSLNGVVAMRGTPTALMALTNNGEIYTWGSNAYLGNGTDKANQSYATKMTLPAGITPKMIGMTAYRLSTVRENSYYLLSTTGVLYSLGNNASKQLGTFDALEQKGWVNVKSSNATTNITNIVWISPNEHDNGGNAYAQALTADGKLWSWGMNNGNTLGSGANGAIDPLLMTGGLTSGDKILAVESGGHTNMIFKACSNKLGYLGHAQNGSMGDGTTASTNYTTFNFTNTPTFSGLCSVELPPIPEVKNLKTCAGNTVNLANALLSTTPAGYTLEWWTTTNRASGTQVTNTSAVSAGTYYAFYISSTSACAATYSTAIVSYYTAIDPEYATCICFRDPVTTGTSQDTKMGITLLKRAGAENTDNWPMVRKGGHVALESNTQGFVITRIAKANLGNIANPQDGMMVYDTTDKCLKLYSNGVWSCFNKPGCPSKFALIDCGNVVIVGDRHLDPNVNFSITVPYVDGDGSSYAQQSFTSSKGALTAVLPAGSFSNGSGTLILTVTGASVTGSGGSYVFPITINGKTCNVTVSITAAPGDT